jgi:ABC-type polysaccharide/polyol phosphate export permease
VYFANPIAHLIEAFRNSILGTHPPDLLVLAVLLVVGVLALVAAQRLFSVFDGVLADVV